MKKPHQNAILDHGTFPTILQDKLDPREILEEGLLVFKKNLKKKAIFYSLPTKNDLCFVKSADVFPKFVSIFSCQIWPFFPNFNVRHSFFQSSTFSVDNLADFVRTWRRIFSQDSSLFPRVRSVRCFSEFQTDFYLEYFQAIQFIFVRKCKIFLGFVRRLFFLYIFPRFVAISSCRICPFFRISNWLSNRIFSSNRVHFRWKIWPTL